MGIRRISGIILGVLVFSAVLAVSDAAVAKKYKQNPTPTYATKHAALVVDASTGTVLQDENSKSLRYPASLTKLMTLYLTFEALDKRRISMSDTARVSRHAASQPNLNLGLRIGDRVKISDLIKGVAVVSANDASVVIAEKLAGSEREFASVMTNRARQLGMKNTNFMNASGLHNPKQMTTAQDIAKLLMAIRRDFPEYYKFLSVDSFYYKGQKFETHNRMMRNYAGAKAGKTGYVRASGFNLALNAEKNGKNIVGVVMGGKSAQLRDKYMKTILDKNFSGQKKTAGFSARSGQYALN